MAPRPVAASSLWQELARERNVNSGKEGRKEEASPMSQPRRERRVRGFPTQQTEACVPADAPRKLRQQPNRGGDATVGGDAAVVIPPPWRRTGDGAQERSNSNGTGTGANERGGGKAGDGTGPHGCGEAERG